MTLLAGRGTFNGPVVVLNAAARGVNDSVLVRRLLPRRVALIPKGKKGTLLIIDTMLGCLVRIVHTHDMGMGLGVGHCDTMAAVSNALMGGVYV